MKSSELFVQTPKIGTSLEVYVNCDSTDQTGQNTLQVNCIAFQTEQGQTSPRLIDISSRKTKSFSIMFAYLTICPRLGPDFHFKVGNICHDSIHINRMKPRTLSQTESFDGKSHRQNERPMRFDGTAAPDTRIGCGGNSPTLQHFSLELVFTKTC